jgi:hypothetical protein
MTDTEFREAVAVRLRARRLPPSDLDHVSIGITRKPNSNGVEFEITGVSLELKKVVEYVIGSVVRDHGIPERDADLVDVDVD